MSRDYPRLSIEEFGRHLLDHGDLDPVYVALHALGWSPAQRNRFLVAYWCLYHCGAAAYLSALEGQDFWAGLGKAARNDELAPNNLRWPRGHERRHWRGQQAVRSFTELANRYRHPEAMVDGLMRAGHNYAEVAARALSHRGFGPWIAFKICDMLDRCTEHHVHFDSTDAFNGIFKDPWEAALQLWRLRCYGDRHARVTARDERRVVSDVIAYLSGYFQAYMAPPKQDRPVGVQEIETILCKWKSHMNGHYPLLNDTREIRLGLQGWAPVSPAAAQFLAVMPPVD